MLSRKARSRTGFTLIEMLVVIGIILLLIGMSVAGFNTVAKHSKGQHTKVALEAAKAMLAEFEATGGKATTAAFKGYWDNAVGPIPAGSPTIVIVPLVVSPVKNGVKWREYSALVTEKLLEIPNNRAIYDKLPSDQKPTTLLTVTLSGPGNPTKGCHEILDGYGNPILFVPSIGVSNMTAGGQAAKFTRFLQSDGMFHDLSNLNDRAPNPRYFWMSAGADGDPAAGDDNHYSFEQ